MAGSETIGRRARRGSLGERARGMVYIEPAEAKGTSIASTYFAG